MKNLFRFTVVIALAAFAGNVSAQQKPLKLAYINMQELIQAMPEYDSAMVKMQKEQKSLEEEMELLRVEYARKLEDHTNNSKNWTDLVKKSREQELVNMQQKMQVFAEGAQENLAAVNDKLMQPIIDKANKAIDAVAKEQGITYVLNAQTIVFKSTDSQDVLPAVKQHLGLTK